MSDLPSRTEMEHFTEELNMLSLYLEDTGYDNDILDPSDEVPVPMLAIDLEGEAAQITAYYMYVATGDSWDREDAEEDEDDVFGQTAYLQAIVSFPIGEITDEDMLNIFLFCSAATHQLPLGSLFITGEKQLAYRNVFAVDKSIGLTREVFLETLFVIQYITRQVMGAVTPLLSGEVDFDEAIERFLVPQT